MSASAVLPIPFARRRELVIVAVMGYTSFSRSIRRVKKYIKITKAGKKNSDTVAPIPKR